jgi:hypothetical protein
MSWRKGEVENCPFSFRTRYIEIVEISRVPVQRRLQATQRTTEVLVKCDFRPFIDRSSLHRRQRCIEWKIESYIGQFSTGGDFGGGVLSGVRMVDEGGGAIGELVKGTVSGDFGCGFDIV